PMLEITSFIFDAGISFEIIRMLLPPLNAFLIIDTVICKVKVNPITVKLQLDYNYIWHGMYEAYKQPQPLVYKGLSCLSFS
ncbi:hypothetical protein R0K17_24060, partial [Planococcus sp. SIMBA_143]